MVLNPSQEKVVQEGVNWYFNSSEQVFEVAGEAGTGKSVVLHEIVNRIKLKNYQVWPMAYTGQASIIMRLKGFKNAKSIHSSLFYLQKIEKDKYSSNNPFNLEFNTPEFEYKFTPIPEGQLPHEVKLFVIDEGYMVPDYMRKTILKHGKKVLVGGDDGQLPPIGGQPAFLTGYNIHYLTELMRQELDNPIVYLAHRARHNLPIHFGSYGCNVIVMDRNEITDKMLLSMGVVICGTNKTRDYFNSHIRYLQGKNSNVPVIGDRVICRNNNWDIVQDNIALANGLSGTIISPVTVDKFDHKSGVFYMDFLPDLLDSPFEDLEVNYNYLISDYETRNTLKNNVLKYDNGELFEYAYALTTHLSQGAEYPYGIFLEEFLRPSIQSQLIYTGITRFQKGLIYLKYSKKYY